MLLVVDDDARYDGAVHDAVKTLQLYERAKVRERLLSLSLSLSLSRPAACTTMGGSRALL